VDREGGSGSGWGRRAGERTCGGAGRQDVREVAGGEDSEELVYSKSDEGEIRWSGWVRGGVWEKWASVCWGDGQEYNGGMLRGAPHGEGMHVFADGSKLFISFDRGCPVGNGTLIDANRHYYDVTYSGERSVRDGAQPIKRVPAAEPLALAYYCQYGGSIPCSSVACGVAQESCRDGGHARSGAKGRHLSAKVRGEFVWARPQYGDLPLWNAEHVQGSIVAMFCGPPPPASPVSISEQLLHAEAAGAAGVILVEQDTRLSGGGRDASSRAPLSREVEHGSCGAESGGGGGGGGGGEGGSVSSTLSCNSSCKIPACYVSRESARLLHQGVEIELRCAEGIVAIPIQNFKGKLSKTEARELMEDFKNLRRQELEGSSS